VLLAREHERGGDALAVNRDGGLVGVLLDDREQIGQQALLVSRQLRPRLLRLWRSYAAGAADASDRSARGRDPRRRARGWNRRGIAAQVRRRSCARVRNRCPSSCLRW
jgi:hypothetical protein